MNRVIHFEILADEPAKLTEFYQNVLGWKVATSNGPQGYWLATTGPAEQHGINGGFMGKHFDQPVINTIEVESLEATLARVRQHGGRLVHGPNDIPGVGRHTYCQDPAGILFGLLQPAAS